MGDKVRGLRRWGLHHLRAMVGRANHLAAIIVIGDQGSSFGLVQGDCRGRGSCVVRAGGGRSLGGRVGGGGR